MNHVLRTTHVPLLLTLGLLLGGCVTIQNNPTPQSGLAQSGGPMIYHAGHSVCTACGHALGSAGALATTGRFEDYGYAQGGLTANGERIIYVPVPAQTQSERVVEAPVQTPQQPSHTTVVVEMPEQQVPQDRRTTTDRVIDLIGAGVDAMGRNRRSGDSDPVVVGNQSKNNDEKKKVDDVIVVRTGGGVERVDCPDTTEDRATDRKRIIYAGGTESATDNGRVTDQISATPTTTTTANDNRRVTDQVSATPTPATPSPTSSSTTARVPSSPAAGTIQPSSLPASSGATSSGATVPASPVNVPISPAPPSATPSATPAVTPAPASTATSGKETTSG